MHLTKNKKGLQRNSNPLDSPLGFIFDFSASGHEVERSVIAPLVNRCPATFENSEGNMKELQSLDASKDRPCKFPNEKTEHLTTLIKGNFSKLMIIKTERKKTSCHVVRLYKLVVHHVALKCFPYNEKQKQIVHVPFEECQLGRSSCQIKRLIFGADMELGTTPKSAFPKKNLLSK